ncbi:ribonuclease H-like protein [Aspergillus ellipticus CBS 707.79]|uniref:Ribonuclease H-like protein n=1 Tax=Aspergillus ellipticus CBS 707.79 TaxID=1448320 RepID=A0A319D8L5_9EURO|nr:ribonuclease H-like protein [Aspergillus ellipticus CBS 707.79]
MVSTSEGNPVHPKNPEPKPSPAQPPAPKFWTHRICKSPEGKNIVVHYCRTLKSSEQVVQHFLNDQAIGFDMEWKAQASGWDSIQNNVSLIQIANRERIALFHIALFKPGKNLTDLVPPTLKRIMEDPNITKLGVSIKADCTRLRKFLKIDAHGIFELSHLHKLVKYCQSNPKLINKRAVNLSEQVEEHFGLPLDKDENVRCGNWALELNYRQVHYAASDSFACVCLFDTMDAKRKALDPMPPLPAHAELDLPIRIVHEPPVAADPSEVGFIKP